MLPSEKDRLLTEPGLGRIRSRIMPVLLFQIGCEMIRLVFEFVGA